MVRNEHPDGGIGAEAPIRTASEDRLRRSGFAARIADVLSELNLREGRVFAIRGGWGFGKSSLKNLITERLDAKSSGADWLDFNPWQWGDGDAISRALFGQIADRLGGEHSKAALDRAEALRRYGAILTGVSKPLKEAGSSGLLISTVLTNASVIAIASAIGYDLPTVAKVAAVLAFSRSEYLFSDAYYRISGVTIAASLSTRYAKRLRLVFANLTGRWLSSSTTLTGSSLIRSGFFFGR
ncbi:P-loop NTPase fold protein [Enterobacter bugandensis]|uniref:P-loop NTPase fold protein n=1 Tax=Enterobacter bugandensis TaxID=881260 RepID=UPI0037552006